MFQPSGVRNSVILRRPSRYKQSGNGREFGREGLEEFLEFKAMLGYNA
jgi:acyl-CoA reductase-like NAD-dependent aldehyde dehydrogenase